MADTDGWREVGVFNGADKPAYEEADFFTQNVVEDEDDIRTVDIYGKGEAKLERQVGNGTRWVTVGELTMEMASDYAYNELGDVLNGSKYRAVCVHGEGVFVEKRVSPNDE